MSDRGLGDHPVVVTLSIVAAVLGIIGFTSGRQSLSEFLGSGSTAGGDNPAVLQESTHETDISGLWTLRAEGRPDDVFVTWMRLKMDGDQLLSSGPDWSGEGEFNGRQGHYEWTFTNGRSGRTTIFLDEDGVLHGRVRGSGIDWDYQATRR